MTSTTSERRPRALETRLPVVDVDVHQTLTVGDQALVERLPRRWRDHLDLIGIRNFSSEQSIVPQREFVHRLDALDEAGRVGFIPDFVRTQHLDLLDVSGVVLSNAAAITLSRGGGNFPEQLALELCRAYNDAHRDIWLEADDRFFLSIHVPFEHPAEAVREILRCKEGPLGDRFVSVVLEPRAEYAIGNPKYWPIFEVCSALGMPIQFHAAPGRRVSPMGDVNYYFESHCGLPLRNFPLVSSLIFEGVFDRFPRLRFSLIEQSWAWAVPFSWRLDATAEVLAAEVGHLARRPSEYFTEHFWFATQPMEEPDPIEEFGELLGMFEETFGPSRLMYSSDYPHWDYDAPSSSVPDHLPVEQRARILGQTAADLYGIPLRQGTGVLVSERAAR